MAKGHTESVARGLIRPRVKRELKGADWGMVDAEELRSAVSTVTARGGALRLGYTRDGGAYAVGIYGLSEPYTEYIRPSEDVEAFLREVAEAFTSQCNMVGIPIERQDPTKPA